MPNKIEDNDVVIDSGVDLDATPVCIPQAETTDGLTPVGPRTSTRPLLKPLRVELDLDDPKSLADFLDHVARLIRERKRIVITIE